MADNPPLRAPDTSSRALIKLAWPLFIANLAVVGNGTIDAGERCDGTNLNGQTCQSQGYGGGTLACNSGCTFNTSGCTALCQPTGTSCTSNTQCCSGSCGKAKNRRVCK